MKKPLTKEEKRDILHCIKLVATDIEEGLEHGGFASKRIEEWEREGLLYFRRLHRIAKHAL